MQHHQEEPKRRILLLILALSWVGNVIAWALLEARGSFAPVQRTVFLLSIAFELVACAVLWWRLLPMRQLMMGCLLYACGLCAGCMALRLYLPAWGGGIDLAPLYLWIPVIHVFVFTLLGHQASLRISLGILALFVAISLPYLAGGIAQPYANVTIQLHVVSAVLIAALHFFSSYQHRFQAAELTMDELARLANTDELTRLANRRRVTEGIAAELLRFARYGHPFSIILVDIDHFKAVNDRFGHRTGDTALVALAVRMMAVLRDVDMLGRWGGEEFVIVLPATRYEETLHKAAALCHHVAGTPLVEGQTLTISCGVSSALDGDDVDRLLQRADQALYAAKHGGRNRAEGVHLEAQPVH